MARLRRRVRHGVHGAGAQTSPEALYARARTAGWLLKSLELNVPFESYFFDCLQWVTGNLPLVLQSVFKETRKITGKPGIVLARKAIKEALARPKNRLASEFEELFEDHPCLQGIIVDIVERECVVSQKLCNRTIAPYSTALKRLEETFGLNKDCQALCEFVFINQNFSAVEGYFEDRLEVHKYGSRRILAHILNIKQSRLQACLGDLFSCGLLDTGYSDQFRLKECLLPFWEEDDLSATELFSRPLSGDTLPLESFQLAPDDIVHVKKLLEQNTKKPVHILLYGPPGTGKSTFARSLAHACGVKAWTVNSREEDDDDDRRASLTSCLHIASKHKGAFVLVDEAERLLDTDRQLGRQTKDKAWLNDFLERPGQRIVWIANHIRHIDQAVRRRFSFSLYFERLSVKKRINIWQQILAKHRVSRKIDNEQVKALAKKHPVEAAIIHSAVSQAKSMYKGKAEFFNALERVLRSQTTLQHNGRKLRDKPQPASDFTLDGVCLEGSAEDLVENCRRVDGIMNAGASVRPGCGTMLFYGPPGTGKTALARHIAKELDRECMVKRASDLLSPYVGVAEQQVAEAFRRAEDEGAVLVIDEADSFIYSRDMARRSWETTLINEFLTNLEECRGFCICTTNRRDNLDSAAMRRFSFKVPFRYAQQEQILALYTSLLSPLASGTLSPQEEQRLCSMKQLAPGDFHSVRSQHWLAEAGTLLHADLVRGLEQEQALKLENVQRRLGF